MNVIPAYRRQRAAKAPKGGPQRLGQDCSPDPSGPPQDQPCGAAGRDKSIAFDLPPQDRAVASDRVLPIRDTGSGPRLPGRDPGSSPRPCPVGLSEAVRQLPQTTDTADKDACPPPADTVVDPAGVPARKRATGGSSASAQAGPRQRRRPLPDTTPDLPGIGTATCPAQSGPPPSATAWWVRTSATQKTGKDGRPAGFRHQLMHGRQRIGDAEFGADAGRTFAAQAVFLNQRGAGAAPVIPASNHS